MPRRDMDLHFAGERPEWTARKHDLLERYVVPASMKLKQFGAPVVLVDGYAGANAYGGRLVGSTAVMIEAALGVIEQGGRAVVHACEPNHGRFVEMRSNLREHVQSGLLHVHNARHADALPLIQAETYGYPAIVFLDPQAVTDLTIAGDIAPWGRRPRTDVLGVFMAGQACRTCGQILARGTRHAVMPEEYLGRGWERGRTDDGAHDVFLQNVRGLKRFAGMYRLRKRASQQEAYGIFGLSDHVDGYWLLSRAVAKDYGLLKEFDLGKMSQPRLFDDLDDGAGEKEDFLRLVGIARAMIVAEPRLRGAALATRLFDAGIGVEELFGVYEEPDFTRAAYHVLGIPERNRAQGQ